MEKPIELRGGNGIRNDVSPERFSLQDLSVGENIDIDETGKVSRRAGRTLVESGEFHSLWSKRGYSFVVKEGVLNRIRAGMSLEPVEAGITRRVAYEFAGDKVYWTDGSKHGVVSASGNNPWGIAPPSKLSVIASAIGDMPPGRYLCSIVYVRNTGQESGAPAAAVVELASQGALVFSDLPVSTDPFVTMKRLYVTKPNGEVMYLAAQIANSITSLTISDDEYIAEIPLRTQFMTACPGGIRVAEYRGHLFVVSGSFVCYSLPYEHELFDPRHFLSFGSEVRTFAPVSDGIFVGLETETLFLSGTDPSKFVVTPKADYGGIVGTETTVRADLLGEEGVGDEVALWMGTSGFCLGFKGGELKNLSSARYAMPKAREGACLFKIRSGTPQALASLFN